MTLYLLQGAVEEGLIYALVALGLYISYETLNIADMTTDGSFVLGAAVSGILTMNGLPLLGLVLGFLAGMGAGFVTGVFQRKMGIPPILAGIITMTSLYTVNLIVQKGSPNLFFSSSPTIFTKIGGVLGTTYGTLVFLMLLNGGIYLLLRWFFTTQIGLSLRATGDNIHMVQASSINPDQTIILGLCLSNGLIALAGGLLAQKNSQSDLSIGTGVVVIGLAGLVVGSILLKNTRVSRGLGGAIFGSILYRILLTVALRYTSDPGYLKIVSGLLVAVVIAYPTLKGKIQQQRNYRQRRKENAGTP